MKRNRTSLILALGAVTMVAVVLAGSSADAAVIAATDFDGRTATGKTASDLNWTLDGLEDPGDITNDTADLFDTTTIVQNNFTPGVNVGNGNTTWIADVSITVATGYDVILEDVTFNAVSVNGGQALNVDRRNDYIVSLIDPGNNPLETITVPDVVSGSSASPNQPLVTIDFADVALGAGTYILRIEAGDKSGVGANETGNHTGIDNLSINGTVPEPTTLALAGLGLMGIIARRRRRR